MLMPMTSAHTEKGKAMTEHTCENCYYRYFDSKAYPCSMCVCGEERKDMWQPKIAEQTEPQYDADKLTIKCDNCSENGSYKCSKCDGEMYFKRLEAEDEPQTDYEKIVWHKDCGWR